jgi:hypothetical protein
MDNLNKDHDDSHNPITPPAVSYYITDWDEFLEGCKHWFGPAKMIVKASYLFFSKTPHVLPFTCDFFALKVR